MKTLFGGQVFNYSIPRTFLAPCVALLTISAALFPTLAAGQVLPTPTTSSQGGPLPYTFTASAGATLVPGTIDTGISCDDCVGTVELPFPVTIYGQAFTSAQVAANGFVEFVGDLPNYSNTQLPDPDFAYTIFALWDDLYTGNEGVFVGTIGAAPNRAFVIEWRGLALNSGATVHFEIIFYENRKDFDIIYAEVGDGGGDATIGIQRDSSQYSQYSYVEPVVVNGLKLSVAPPIPPVPNNDSVTLNVNNPAAAIDVLGNDSDPLGAVIRVSSVDAAAHGTVTVAADGASVSYAPAADFIGSDSFTYCITNTRGVSACATVDVTVVNHNPTARDDAATLDEDTSVTVNVLANDDYAPDFNETLQVTSAGAAAHGTVSYSATSVIYTPAANYFGPDAFTYAISDGHGGTANATVRITVNPVNDPPVANDDSIVMDEDTSATINVLANDTFAPDVGETLTVVAVGAASHGTVTFSTATVTYTPAANYFGADSFQYTISDGNGGTATATVHVTVANVNDDPVANDDAVTMDEDTSVTIDVLANDTSAPDVGETLTITGVGQAAHGTVTFSATAITYTPAANYFGSDSFQYAISDGNGGTATARVNVTVRNVNDNPVANDDTAVLDEDTSVTINVLANDSFAPDVGETLTVTAVGAALHGTVAFTANSVTYTPAANYNGPDSFQYTISDGNGGTATARVNVTVRSVNDDPVANDDTVALDEDTSITINVLANDSTGPDTGETLTITAVGAAAHGAVSFSATAITYTPAANYFGPDSFLYTISDGNGGTATARVNVTVRSVNDDPTAQNDVVTVDQDSSAVIDVLANDTSAPDVGETLTITGVSAASHGTVSFSATAVTYTPAAGYSGADAFQYTISDGNGGTGMARVDVTVRTVNTAPVVILADGDGFTVNENDVFTLNGMVIDPDANDSHTLTVNWGDGSAPTTVTLAAGVSQFSVTHQYLDDQPTGTPADAYTVVAVAMDSKGASGQKSTVTTVRNVAPVITSVTGPTAPVAIGATVTVSVNFSDVGSLDTHTVRITWADGSADTVLTSGGYSRSASHAYAVGGVYTIGITVTDDDGGTATATFPYVVVHDPSGGFVTGGGWFTSVAGAYAADASAHGRATFGFVARTGTTSPRGETELHLGFTKFDFKSTSYEWFVISGNTAQCKGAGRINGSGDYSFILTAVDGGSGAPDQVRLKIWNTATGAVVYDNGLGAPDDLETANPTPINGGNVVIHRTN